MKKYLALLLAMLMLVTSLGLNVFATGDEECIAHRAGTEVKVYPTCTEEGYTVVLCKNCGEEISRTINELPLEHQFYHSEYVAVADNATSLNKAAYNKVYTCTRTYRDKDGKTVPCGEQKYETKGDKPVVYYLVRFINNKVPNADKKYTDPNGVELIDTTAFDSIELARYFVEKGTVGQYSVGVPFLGKTADFGTHVFDGWTTNANLGTPKASYEKEDYADIYSPIEEATTFYPVFVGQKVDYTVNFYSADGPITNFKGVTHGESAYYRVNGSATGDRYVEPPKEDDLANYYNFAGWSTLPRQEIGLSTDTLEKTPIYDVTTYIASYKAVPKNYNVEFYGYVRDNESEPIFTLDKDNEVNLNTNLYVKHQSDFVALESSDDVVKPSDDSYQYIFSGWRILKTDIDGNEVLGDFVDLQNFNIKSVGDYFVDLNEDGSEVTETRTVTVEQIGKKEDVTYEEPVKTIKLVPAYDERLLVYYVGVDMIIPDDEDADYYRGNAAVRVFNEKGDMVASGKTDDNGFFRCKLSNIPDNSYTIKVTTSDSKYLGETVVSRAFVRGDNADEESKILNLCKVNMVENPEYETSCSCIHHNPLIQPIWVRILNILYSLFNKRYECCYDMYSTIGPLLDYTQE